MSEQMVRLCKDPSCGKPLYRKKLQSGYKETLAKFHSREYCGLECKNHYAWASMPDTYCLYCGTQLKVREGEEIGNFKRRNTCGSSKCYSLSRKDGARKRGVNVSHAPKMVTVVLEPIDLFLMMPLHITTSSNEQKADVL